MFVLPFWYFDSSLVVALKIQLVGNFLFIISKPKNVTDYKYWMLSWDVSRASTDCLFSDAVTRRYCCGAGSATDCKPFVRCWKSCKKSLADGLNEIVGVGATATCRSTRTAEHDLYNLFYKLVVSIRQFRGFKKNMKKYTV